MDTRWIQDFVTLAEVRNFTRAAEIRNVSQAAFSRRIQALEHWIGASLVDRTAYPLKLTGEGERFRSIASTLVSQIAEARAEIGGEPSRNHTRIAMPYALATTRFPEWWSRWVPDQAITCSVDVGNVHDTVSALAAGSVDVLISYTHAAHPIQLEPARFERHELGVEKVRPYASRSLVDAGRATLPGTQLQPIPLLMYSSSVYFSRVVDTAIETAGEQLAGFRVIEAGMSDVLGDLAAHGLGVAWLPDSTFAGGRLGELIPVGEGRWDLEVAVVAYRSRANARRAAMQLWERIVQPG